MGVDTESTSSDRQAQDQQLAKESFERIAADLQMIVDRDVFVTDFRAERADSRPAADGGVHISFRHGYVEGAQTNHGCLLLPLAEVVTLASYLMMVPDEDVEGRRDLDDLDRTTKDAILELGNFVAGALEGVMREQTEGSVGVRPEGCQGVRSNVRPAFEYEEGAELIVGRAEMQVHSFPRFEGILIVPALDRLSVT